MDVAANTAGAIVAFLVLVLWKAKSKVWTLLFFILHNRFLLKKKTVFLLLLCHKSLLK
jgi:hypothetical protein